MHRRTRAGQWLTTAAVLLWMLPGCSSDPASETNKSGMTWSGSLGDAAVSFGGDDVAWDSASVMDAQQMDTGISDTDSTNVSTGDTTEVGADAATAVDSGAAADSGEPVCPGAPGCICAQDSDCTSTPCVTSTDGKSTCAQPCPTGSCGDGFTCVSGDKGTYCMPKDVTLCEPCTTNEACGIPGANGARCVPIGTLGAFCGKVCNESADCPSGYVCSDTKDIAGKDTKQCQPAAGAVCTCTIRAQIKGLKTACGAAACLGERACLLSGKPTAPVGGGLSACSGPTPKPESCNGKDDDCDGETDEESCDDKDSCTSDTCGGTSCLHIPTPGAPCDDGDKCTNSDKCSSGGKAVCVGVAKVCNSGDPCASGSCDPKTGVCGNNGTSGKVCNDGDACTETDVCKGGVCTGVAKVCDDKNPCTTDACDKSKGCEYSSAKVGTVCDDGSLCTTADACNTKGACAGKPKLCPKGLACLPEACDAKTGSCTKKPAQDGSSCNDGDPCTSADACAKGMCSGKAVVCDDKNVCTVDACNAKLGCTHVVSVGKVCGKGLMCDAAGACSGSCTTFDVTYGNELETPKTTTSLEYLHSVAATTDGTYSAGYVYSGSSARQGLLMRRTGTGKRLWAKQFGGVGSYEVFRAVTARSDGGAWAAGYRSKGAKGGYDGWLVRVDSNGKQLSSADFGGTGSDYFYSMAQTTNNGVVMAGRRYINSGSGFDAWIVQVNDAGKLTGVKERTFGGSGSQQLYGISYNAKNGLVAAAGSATVSGMGQQGFLARMTSNGLVSNKLLGGKSSDYLQDVTFLPDGRIVAVGYTYTNTAGSSDGWIVTATDTLSGIKEARIGGVTSDRFESVHAAGSEAVAVGWTGDTGSNSGWVVRLSTAGVAVVGANVLSSSRHGGPKSDYLYDVTAVTGGWAAAGRTYSRSLNADTWELRLNNKGETTCDCDRYEARHGAEEGAPKVSTSSELLYGLAPRAAGGTVAVGYRYLGKSLGYQGLIISRYTAGKLRFVKTYGGSGSEYLRGAAQASKGSTWAAGYTSKSIKGGYDGWLLRVDDTGKVLHQSYHGGSGTDRFMAVASTGPLGLDGLVSPDGGAVVGGYRYSNTTTGYDLWLKQVNATGATTGFKEKVILANGGDYGFGVAWHSAAQRAIIAGYRYETGKSNQGQIAWVDAKGASALAKYGDLGSDIFRAVTVQSNGYIVAVGSTSGGAQSGLKGGEDGWVVRTSSNLSGAKEVIVGGVATDRLSSVTPGRFGGVVVAGISSSPSMGGYDGAAWWINTTTGTRVGLQQHYGGDKSDEFYAATTLPNGYGFAGGTYSHTTNRDTWQLSVDEYGSAACKVDSSTCSTSSMCDDGKPCTLNRCESGKCTFPIATEMPCGASFQCTSKAICSCNLYDRIMGYEPGDIGGSKLNEYIVAVARGGKGGSFAVGYVFEGGALATQGLVIHRDDLGNRVWVSKAGGAGSDYFHAAVSRNDGGLWAVGYTTKGSFGATDGWVVRFDAKGKSISQKMYGTKGSDYLYGAARFGASGLVVVGRKGVGSSKAGWVMWLNNIGNQSGLKERMFGVGTTDTGLGATWDQATGTTIVSGTASISGKSTQAVLTTVTTAGTVKSVALGGTGFESLSKVAVNKAGVVMAVGITSSEKAQGIDGLAVRTDLKLTTPKLVTHGGTGTDVFSDVVVDGFSRFMAVGYSSKSSKGDTDGWMQGLSAASGNKSGIEMRFGGSKANYFYGIDHGGDGTWILAGRTAEKSSADAWSLRVSATGGLTCAGK